MTVPIELSRDEARRIALRAQALIGAPDHRGGARAMLRRLGAVQLDTISVLARSHELVAYARLGAIGRPAVEAAYWSAAPASTFEYWSHAACVLPVEQWPWFGFRRRAIRARGRRWHQVPEQAGSEVLARLRSEGPLTATELGGAKGGGPWWDWSEVKIAVEWLLDIGEVVCTERRGWRRVYDLPERALLGDLLDAAPDDRQCLAYLVEQAGRALGIADAGDLAEHHRLLRKQVTDVIADTALVPVRVRGWDTATWAHPDSLDELDRRGRHRTTLLSPFDSLVWDRRRTERIFGFRHTLEAYVPAPKRVHGYFAMPLLHRGRLVARVDPKRSGQTLVARHVSVEPGAAPDHVTAGLAVALREAAEWVGCSAVRIERVSPPSFAPTICGELTDSRGMALLSS